MNVLAKIDVFKVRRVILELKIDPKSFEEEQKTTSKHNKREEGGPIGAPKRPESRFIGPVDVLERLQAQGGAPGNLRAAPGGPPGRHNVSKNLCLFRSLEGPTLARNRPEVGGIVRVMITRNNNQ